MNISGVITRFTRRKLISADEVSSTQLKRCLTSLDLTALGIGSTLGLGIYVLAGKVAKDTAGPSVTISFLVAAVASVFAGLCYAEFGARVPRTGSAYVYSYVTVGELIAFVIGWNLIMEYAIGTASVAKGYSSYLDFLINHAMGKELSRVVPLNTTGLSPYPDFLASGITCFLTVVLSVGVKESSSFNNVFTLLNLLVVVYVVVCGAIKSDVKNWRLTKDEIPSPEYGVGGFFPYGVSGMLSGAATCFYGFIGFDCIATTGEEVKNPKRAIPIGIILSLFIIFLAYFGIATVTTLLVPYYEQDPDAPLPHVFDSVGWPVAKWIVSVGALAGLSTSLLGSMFPLPRIIYAMAADGLIFRWLSVVHPKLKTPIIASLLGGLVTAALALILNLDQLIEMMSIGTLMAYTIVAACILLLRYRPKDDGEDDQARKVSSCTLGTDSTETLHQDTPKNPRSCCIGAILSQYFNVNRLENPTESSSFIVTWNVRILTLSTIWLAANVIFLETQLGSGISWAIILVVLSCVFIVIPLLSISRQPQSKESLSFKVPGVPFVPWLSLFINIFLMLKLNAMTWVRFAVWLAIGLVIYFLYGVRESSEEYRSRGKTPPMPNYGDSGDSENAGCCSCLRSSKRKKQFYLGNQEIVKGEIFSIETKNGQQAA